MADKSIDQLPVSDGLTNEGLLVVYQNDEAQSIKGELVAQFARESVEEHATQAADQAARQAASIAAEQMEVYAQRAESGAGLAQKYAMDAEAGAEAASAYAQSVNPDELNARIENKGDNLEFDTEEGLLYLTSGGVRIGDGIKVATSGGGGGGGESNNAVLTVANTTGWIYKTVSEDAPVSVSFSWSSLENGMETGAGVLKITVGGTTKYTGQIEQGEHSMDISGYLGAGGNAVKLNVTDVYGNSRSLSFNLTVVSLLLESTFDSSVAYSGAIAFPYTPTAAVEKTMHFKVDGNEVGTATVTSSGRQQTYTIPAQSHGAHQLEAWFTANVNGETVPSNRLYYTIICTEAGNTTPIIAVDWRQESVEQFDNLAIPYIVYDPGSLTAKVSLHSSESGEQGELTVDRTRQTWSYRVENAGELTLTVSCVGASGLSRMVSISMTASESTIDVNAETEDLTLHLTSYGRSNNEDNPGTWKYGDVAATLTGFNFTSDGWMEDEKGITVLRVGGDARVEIPVQMFAKDFRTTGKTIEIEFASRSVLDYDAILATCWSGDRGFQITAQQSVLKSEQSEVTTRYKEEDHLRLSFVIEKRSGNRLILGYVNGIISGMLQYPDDDDFSQSVPVSISLGSNDCTIDIYNIRVYDNDLNRFQMLDNWIADTQDLGEKKDRYDRNDIFDDYGQILPTTLRPDQKYLVLDCPVLPTYKGDKKTCSGRYVDPVDEKRSFTFEGAEIDVQGTSSQYYYVKNFKIKFKGGFVQNGKTNEKYAMNENAVPTAEFTFKADVASSEGANNVVLAEMYNDLCPVKTPAQERDGRIRQTIEGHPIVVFHDDGSGAKFIGKYNFNNDKGTAEVFGFASGDESWEILENGNALVSFKSADFTNWKTAFEARYPEDNEDISRLQEFVAWVASTNTDGKTGTARQALLDKFKRELPNWANVDDAIFYYLFTLVFLCIDQREKNAFPTYNAEMAKWLWLFYDADSSIGTDNKGNLTFEYWMEDIDFTEAGDPVFNGQNNVFWSNLRECFADEIRDEYRRLRTEIGADGKALLSYDKVNELFTAHQSQWSEAIYNEDAWRKAVEPLEKANDPQYLPMQQGKKEQHFKHWMYNRFRYLDSKFETGAALDDENRIMMRAHAQGNIKLTSYINMYGQVYFNAARDEHRMMRDQEYEFVWKAEGAEDAVIGVNSAPMITSMGDLSPLMLEYCHIQYASHLTELKLGDGADGYVNDNLNSITLGNNRLLKKLDVRNCTKLTQSVDASGCTNIEEVYFDGSSITGLSLPNGGNLKKLHLPATVTNLTLRNQTKLTEFVMPSYTNVSTLRLENAPSCVDTWTILHQIPANSRVRVIGFDWTVDSVEDALALYDYLDTMRGLDENGNNVDKAQMSGTIRLDSITGAQLADMQSRYPSITVVYQHIVSNLYFYNDTGTTLLYTCACADGADGTYSGSTPTKASDAQYTYTFAGWSKTPGGSADSTALKAVTADRKVYAAYSKTVRKYTVYWKNGSTTLETDSNVPYGTVPTYNGSTPVDTTNGLAWLGWSPAVGPITGNTTYTATFESPVEVAEIADDWDTILENIDNGTYSSVYKVGNYKPLDLGSEGTINMQVVAIDEFAEIADGQYAPMTFVAQDLLATSVKMRVADDWLQSGAYTHLQNVVKPLLPESVSSRLKTPVVAGSDLWIPSTAEVDAASGSTAAKWFPILRQMSNTEKAAWKTKKKSGATSAADWLTRTTLTYSGTKYYGTVNGGNSGYGGLTTAYAVCLCFCLGTSEITDSWETIAANIEDGSYKTKYSIGQYKPVDLGSEGVINMQIAAFDADALADGSGTAAISWVAKESLLTTSRMSPGIVKVSDGVYQEGTGSIGGWDKSEMRSYLETTLLPTISSSLRDIIAPVKKVSMSTAVSGTSFTEVETVDSLWIPSSRELNGLSGYGSAEKNGCQYSELYKSDAAKIVYTQSGSKCTYSTRSAKDMDEYLTVGTSGRVYNNIQTTTKSGVCLGFCTGRTP